MYCMEKLKNSYEILDDLFHYLVHHDYCFDFHMIQMILR